MTRSATRRYRAAYISLIGAMVALLLKLGAFILTDSVAFLSDAAESVVNVLSALALLYAMRVATRPADLQHPYGHAKAEVVSSALEGGMILVAGGMIVISALPRLVAPEPLANVGVGMVVAVAAAVVNGLLVVYLRREASKLHSVALAANARHLLTDVWTSLGVVLAVGLVILTGQSRLDPLIALAVAVNILREGAGVLRQSVSQLMDERLPEAEEEIILNVANAHPGVLGYHRLRTRQAGFGRFAELDIFVAPELSVRAAHNLVVELEDEIHGLLPNLITTIHVEPYEPGRREGVSAPRDELGDTS